MHELYLTADDRRRHLYVIGKTGVGKSTFLENLIESDLDSRGFCVIDPHGTTAENIADRIPNRRTNDVLHLDPVELSASVAFNVLEDVAADASPPAASQIVSSFKAIWGHSWGPRLKYIPPSPTLGRFAIVRRQNLDNHARPRAIVEKAIEGFLNTR